MQRRERKSNKQKEAVFLIKKQTNKTKQKHNSLKKKMKKEKRKGKEKKKRKRKKECKITDLYMLDFSS